MEGSRKIIAAAVIVAIALGVVFIKGDVPPGLGSLLATIFAAFVAGNAVEHAAAAYRDVNGNGVPDDQEGAPEAQPAPDALARIEEGVAKCQEALSLIIQKVFGPKA